MAKYVYPAIFTREENGQYSVNFPDVESCYTGGDSLVEALENAKDVLCMTLYDLEKESKDIPNVSDIKSISLKINEFANLIECDTEFYKRYYENKSVKKNCTLPYWLNVIAEENNINFSAVLQEALKQKLNIC
ncbi:MAG: type II toxin-antitoxin system HicB family antitoxin [Ruminococcus sp.]|nr:type II toxin-antitoxin system HicB family antitoxin [Ruminococcus sp.]